MAHSYNQFLFSLNKMPVMLQGEFTVGATGSVSGIKGSGISTVTRTGTGAYDIVFDDKYNKFLGFQACASVASSTSGLDHIEVVGTPDTTVAASTPKVSVQSVLAGSVANPTSGAVIHFMVWLRKSSVKGKGE
jgi:hypothetical protein